MYPLMRIDLKKLDENIKYIKNEIQEFEIMAVLKGINSEKKITEAFIKNGIFSFGETSIDNIRKMRKRYGESIKITFLRVPMEREMEEAALLCDEILVSHETKIENLIRINNKIKITVMVDIGDSREGININEIDKLRKFSGNICAVGAVKGCLTQKLPSIEDFEKLEKARLKFEKEMLISIGGTYFFDIIKYLHPGKGIFRAGEIFFTGKNPLSNIKIDGLHNDVFRIEGEITELNYRNGRKKAVCVMGNDFFNPSGTITENKNIIIEGFTSEHMILDIDDAVEIDVGDTIRFIPDYTALLTFFKGNCKKNTIFSTF